ncbi:hypothetical protein HYD71_03785 [Mycoplasmopsis bovis]|nr:hypothetical protein [Mycoplasmopsis bovis]QQH49419.1 hypothetical protein HYD71_03785 [Mycoplasmopsis bovis]
MWWNQRRKETEAWKPDKDTKTQGQEAPKTQDKEPKHRKDKQTERTPATDKDTEQKGHRTERTSNHKRTET